MRSFLLGILLLVTPTFVPGGAQLAAQKNATPEGKATGRNYALFFLNTSFDDPAWPRLPEVKTEVEKLRDALRDHHGFETEIVVPANKDAIVDKIADYNARLRLDDRFVVFFSTHGLYNAETNRGYLVPRSGRTDDRYGRTLLSYDDLGTLLTLSPSRHVLLLLDACYSGSFGDRNRGAPGGSAADESSDCRTKIALADRYKCRLFAAAGNKTAKTPARSKFAAKLLEALRANRDVLRWRDVRRFLAEVEAPECETGTFLGHEAAGDFVFVKNGGCRPASGPGTDATSTTSTMDDKDGDGVADTNDKCPDAYGPAALAGCPALDKDNDGIPDYSDLCPDKPGQPSFQGCPDSDGDEIPDDKDGCPTEKGLAADQGCPTLVQCGFKTNDFALMMGSGPFNMGTDDRDADKSEKPFRKVWLDEFFMGRYEVTIGQFKIFVDETGYRTDAEKEDSSYVWNGTKWMASAGVNWRHDEQGTIRPADQHTYPVVHVSWNDAKSYCEWLSRKTGKQYWLPTEAEWERSARYGDRGPDAKYSGSDNLDQVAWYVSNSGGKVHPVGQKQVNAYGLYDMSGNVWEWCADWYGDYTTAYYRPKGPDFGTERVIRGGSFISDAPHCRVARRSHLTPSSHFGNVGFRLVRLF